jgi:hypothetical protein
MHDYVNAAYISSVTKIVTCLLSKVEEGLQRTVSW